MRRPPFTRWLGIVLRGVHLVTVIFLGAALLGGGTTTVAVAAVMLSGITLFALDCWVYPGHLFEIAGASVLIKLLLIAGMALETSTRVPLFWIVVFWSVLFSHAPASLRHRRWR